MDSDGRAGEAAPSRGAREVEYGELPELTRGLRALGSVRRGGTGQAQFFQPLLDARRRASDARDPAACVRAFDASDLRRALDRAIDRIIQEWPDARASARRALRAQLAERVGDYSRALSALSARSSEVTSAAEAGRLEAWRAWTTQLAAVFEAADRAWISLRSVIEALPPKG